MSNLNSSSVRYLPGRRDAFIKLQAINARTRGRGYCFSKTIPDNNEPKMQITIFNDRDIEGNKVDVYDYGFPVSFAEASQTPNNFYFTPYTVRYREHKLCVSYKVHFSITSMTPIRDHISVDLVIHAKDKGIITSDGKVHDSDIYLKFHYFPINKLPELAAKDRCFGDIRLKLNPELQGILRELLIATQKEGLLTDFGDYDFTCSTDSDNLGELLRLSKPKLSCR